MDLLIDGYNLLWAGNIVGKPGRGTSLMRSRTALLELLLRWIPESRRERTLVVFDASEAPPGLPKEQTWRRIRIRFADRREEADDVLIRLIESSTHPRRLVVVSSDHKIQRAARRRGARAVDSQDWLREVRRAVREDARCDEEAKPADAETGDTSFWLEFFLLEVDRNAEDLHGGRNGETEGAAGDDEQALDDGGRNGARGLFPEELLAEIDELIDEWNDEGLAE